MKSSPAQFAKISTTDRVEYFSKSNRLFSLHRLQRPNYLVKSTSTNQHLTLSNATCSLLSKLAFLNLHNRPPTQLHKPVHNLQPVCRRHSALAYKRRSLIARRTGTQSASACIHASTEIALKQHYFCAVKIALHRNFLRITFNFASQNFDFASQTAMRYRINSSLLHRHTCTDTHAQTHMHRHTCTDTHAQTHMHRHTCTDTHAQTHMHRHTCTDTHAQTHMHRHTWQMGTYTSHRAVIGHRCQANLS